MDLLSSTFANINRYKERVDNGLLNCIPWGFRFDAHVPGPEKARQYLITANTKVGKSTVADELFIHKPIEFCMKNHEKHSIDVEVFKFNLEESTQELMYKLMVRRLITKDRISLSVADLKSTRESLHENVLRKLREDELYFEEYLKRMNFISDVRTANGIIEYMYEILLRPEYGEIIQGNYVPKDPEKYIIVQVDHISLLQGKKYDQIDTISKRCAVELRNVFGCTVVLIQQQKADQESREAVKMNALKPSTEGLADNKDSARDADYVFGLFSPYRHESLRNTHYEKYNIAVWKDHIRFMEVLVSRHGGSIEILPLFFDGKSKLVTEMPHNKDKVAQERFYRRNVLLDKTIP